LLPRRGRLPGHIHPKQPQLLIRFTIQLWKLGSVIRAAAAGTESANPGEAIRVFNSYGE